jgi:UDP-glucose 4-epimerase
MKIAITGSNGYIGSTLVEKLKNTDHNIHLIDINDWDIRTTPMKDGLPHHWLSFDVVVHLAALVRVGESVEKPWDYYNTNINGTQKIITHFPDTKIIFASTGAAFDPTSPYAKSKVAAEDLIRNQCKDYTIFRFFNVGGGKPSNPDGLYAATKNACKSGTFTIHGRNYNTKDGTCVRDYVHVDDLCDAIISAIYEQGAMTEYEPIGSGNSYTVLEYVNAFLEENGPKFKVEFGPRREGDNESSEVPFMSKFMNPQKTLKDIVKL